MVCGQPVSNRLPRRALSEPTAWVCSPVAAEAVRESVPESFRPRSVRAPHYSRKMAYTTNHSTKIFWDEAGSGEPLLLIMGLGYSHEMWHRTWPLMAHHFRTIVFDNRGVGKSDVPPRPVSGRAHGCRRSIGSRRGGHRTRPRVRRLDGRHDRAGVRDSLPAAREIAGSGLHRVRRAEFDSGCAERAADPDGPRHHDSRGRRGSHGAPSSTTRPRRARASRKTWPSGDAPFRARLATWPKCKAFYPGPVLIG